MDPENFFDLEPGERALRMDQACDRFGVSNFGDLTPDERATVIHPKEFY